MSWRTQAELQKQRRILKIFANGKRNRQALCAFVVSEMKGEVTIDADKFEEEYYKLLPEANVMELIGGLQALQIEDREQGN